MIRKLLIVCLMLLALAGVAQAQGEPTQRFYPTPENVEIVKEDGGFTLVVSGTLTNGCTDMTVNTERVGAAWFVDIYRELPLDVICPAAMTPYELRIDAAALFELDADAQLVSVIIINGVIYGVDRAQIEDTPGADMPAPMLNQYWVRGDLSYNTVTIVQNEAGEADVTLTAHLTDGCALPIYRAYGVWDQEGQMMLDAYTVVPINAGCMVIDETRDITISSLIFYALSVNGIAVPHNTTTSEAGTYSFVVQDMGVASVDVGWVKMPAGSDPTVIIRVTGTTDGCDFPIQVVLGKPVDNIYTVKVVRVMPADIACTMIAREFTAEQPFTLPWVGDSPLTFIIGDKTIVLAAE